MGSNWLYARLEGLWHKTLGHDVKWSGNRDALCKGDIICKTCNITIWCRWYDPNIVGGRKL